MFSDDNNALPLCFNRNESFYFFQPEHFPCWNIQASLYTSRPLIAPSFYAMLRARPEALSLNHLVISLEELSFPVIIVKDFN